MYLLTGTAYASAMRVHHNHNPSRWMEGSQPASTKNMLLYLPRLPRAITARRERPPCPQFTECVLEPRESGVMCAPMPVPCASATATMQQAASSCSASHSRRQKLGKAKGNPSIIWGDVPTSVYKSRSVSRVTENARQCHSNFCVSAQR